MALTCFTIAYHARLSWKGDRVALTADTDSDNLVFQCGADVNLASAAGSTPLHAAAANGCYNTALLLLAHGADVEASYSSNQGEQITPMSLTTCSKVCSGSEPPNS